MLFHTEFGDQRHVNASGRVRVMADFLRRLEDQRAARAGELEMGNGPALAAEKLRKDAR